MAASSSGHRSVVLAEAEAFQWDCLPPDIQESILFRLPISTLIVCKYLSRSLFSIIRSPSFLSTYSSRRRLHREDIFLPLFADRERPGCSAAYRPFDRRWFSFPIPESITHVLVADGGHAIITGPKPKEEGNAVLDLFSGALARIKPPAGTRPMHYLLTLIGHEEASSAHYEVVAVGHASEAVLSQVFDSRSGRWEPKGQLPGRYAILGNAVLLDGLLFVLSRIPDCLVSFDPASGTWRRMDVGVPPAMFCWHIMAFGDRLFFIGGQEVDMLVASIGIWELDLAAREWKLVCFMPDDIFRKFSGPRLNNFQAVDRMGIICFHNTREAVIVLYDLSERIWWWPDECSLFPKRRQRWLGLALELQPRVLM